MMTNPLHSFRLPTGELVIRPAVEDVGGEGVVGLLSSLLREEAVVFTFSLMSAFSALWFLAG